MFHVYLLFECYKKENILFQEMACISMFMSGNPREQKYPFHYMESAITTYLQSCKYVTNTVNKVINITLLKIRYCCFLLNHMGLGLVGLSEFLINF